MPCGRVLRVVMLGIAWMLLEGSLEHSHALCDSFTDPLQKAQCATSNMQGTGALDRSTVSGQQGAVPQYNGTSGCLDASCAGSPAAGYFSDSGDVSGLNSATSSTFGSDPNAAAVQQMGTDASGWNLTTSPPVTTANTVADTISATPNAQSCTDVMVCVSWTQAPATTQTCTRPGNGFLACQVVVTNSIREDRQTGGPAGWQGWCVDHYMYIRVLNPTPNSYTVQWQGTGPDGTVGMNCGGISWRTFANFSFIPPTLAADEQLVLVNFSVTIQISGQCGSLSYSTSVIGTRQLVMTCGAGGAQSGSIRASSWMKLWVIRKDVIDDQCAGVRSSGWNLLSDSCQDNAPRTLTLSSGSTVTLNPPTAAPANSCWLRNQEWGYTSTTADTCAPLLASGCWDVSSTCIDPIPGGCNTYEVTVQCNGGAVCAQQNVVQQCTTCGAPGSYVPFCMDTSTPPNQNFQITATMMAVAQAVQNDFDKDALRIFTGQAKGCTYSTFGTMFVDCCADDPSAMFGSCSDTEISLAGDKRAKQVIYVGTMCTEWWSFGLGSICAMNEDVYCTYNSELARIIQQQGRPQLGLNWGTPQAPICDGFTIYEFASLNFQVMDFSEYFSNITSNYDAAGAAASLKQQACALDPSAPSCL